MTSASEIEKLFDNLSLNVNKKDLSEQISNTIRSGEDIVTYCSLMPITLTYHHLTVAKILSNMSRLGISVVINIQDATMYHHVVFQDKITRSHEETVEACEGKFRNLLQALDADLHKVELCRFSELIERFRREEGNLSHWFSITSIKIPETYAERRERVDHLISDTLDIAFARKLNDLRLASCPAKLILCGESKCQSYMDITKGVDPVVVSMPALPNFRLEEGNDYKYSDIDNRQDDIAKYVLKFLKSTSEDSINRINNLHDFFLPLFLDRWYVVRNGELKTVKKLEKQSETQHIKKALTSPASTVKLQEAITYNLHEIFESAKKKLEKIDIQSRTSVRLDIKSTKELSQVFKVLANPKKLSLFLNCDGKRVRKDLMPLCGLKESALSEALKELENLKLIDLHGQKPIRLFDKIPEIDLKKLKFGAA